MSRSNIFLGLTLALASATGIAGQILLARQSHVAFGLGFEFILFSLAIAGIGLGAFGSFFVSYNRPADQVKKVIKIALLGLPLGVVVPFLILHFVNAFPGDLPYRILSGIFFLTSFLPYCILGVAVSLIFKYAARQTAVLYGCDLVGGAIGATGIIFLMDIVGVEASTGLLGLTAAATAVSYLIYIGQDRKLMLLPLLFVTLPLLALVSNSFQVTCSSGQKPLLVGTNSYSQINIETLNRDPTQVVLESLGTTPKTKPASVQIFNLIRDCRERGAYFLKFDQLGDVSFLKGGIYNLPYLLRQYHHIVELGAGPGNAMIVGRLNGVEDITAIEINPLAVSTLSQFVNYNIYQDPHVQMKLVEGRNYVQSLDKNQDLIFLFTREFGGVGTAAYAFSQNYLYTKEAYQAYLDHLSPNGAVAIAANNQFIDELLGTVTQTLRDENLTPSQHLSLSKGQIYSLLLISKSAFTEGEIKNFPAQTSGIGFTTTFLDDQALTKYITEPLVVTDDKPSFWDVTGLLATIDPNRPTPPQFSDSRTKSILTDFLILLALTAVLMVALIVIPLRWRGRGGNRSTKWLALFFSAVSIGFIALELTLMQKLALFLQQPEYPIAVALASFLFFGGIGSLVSTRLAGQNLINNLRKIIIGIVAIGAGYTFGFDSLFGQFAYLSLPERLALAVALLAIPSFLVGMVFPLGLKLTAAVSENFIPWVFSLDGVGSVFGGVLAEIVFLILGFKAEMGLALVMYALAALILTKVKLGGRDA